MRSAWHSSTDGDRKHTIESPVPPYHDLEIGLEPIPLGRLVPGDRDR
ncbi:MAG: hypothetical protein V9G12_19435 [Microthrixaceae bacterium]